MQRRRRAVRRPGQGSPSALSGRAAGAARPLPDGSNTAEAATTTGPRTGISIPAVLSRWPRRVLGASSPPHQTDRRLRVRSGTVQKRRKVNRPRNICTTDTMSPCYLFKSNRSVAARVEDLMPCTAASGRIQRRRTDRCARCQSRGLQSTGSGANPARSVADASVAAPPAHGLHWQHRDKSKNPAFMTPAPRALLQALYRICIMRFIACFAECAASIPMRSFPPTRQTLAFGWRSEDEPTLIQ